MGSISSTKKHPGAGFIFLGLADPSRNRLASMAYQNNLIVLRWWVHMH